MLSKFKIVLVETSHPGNIGAVARAMKNMSMENLCLVAPKIFPSADATARASGANDILSSLERCETLEQAVADCHVVVGASARDRTISWPELAVRECAEKFVSAAFSDVRIALVFGRENSGLKNHELDLCQYLLRIPCNPDFSSLNLAAAVQVVCYELFIAAGDYRQPEIGDRGADPLATAEQMEFFYQHLHQTMQDIGFLHPDKSKTIMRRLRRIFNRTHLDVKELDILRGILRFSQNHNVKKGND
ncbi:RNA methyltransferase [Methylomarinum sp. Ch1-1]|uniref:tRNA (cytidine/uridine-2'-O-)-methyltransferase TrmJ n=1 Tax=Methylomarinum roseum TaxID=3067653 RepID=A0AAU7NUC6_9GAMM|nr:RNA methyltransferase [Methylomarinum sp. Ch1-1]MDP4519325.1 RNA methyltransferase [Methylomarinum sp. Ch1-1]